MRCAGCENRKRIEGGVLVLIKMIESFAVYR
jgi:hypothetical protein